MVKGGGGEGSAVGGYRWALGWVLVGVRVALKTAVGLWAAN